MPVIIGVDPHKASCTAAALDERGELLDQQRIRQPPGRARGPLRPLGQALAASGAGPSRAPAASAAALAQQLVGDGEQVVDVPAKLAARVRLLSAGHGRKSDAHDAVSVAVAALGTTRLAPGPPRGPRQRPAAAVGPPRRPGRVSAPRPSTGSMAAVRPAPRRRQAQPGRRHRGRAAAPAATSHRAGPDPPAARRRPGRRPPRPGPADHRGRRTPPARRHPVGNHPHRAVRRRPDSGRQAPGRGRRPSAPAR